MSLSKPVNDALGAVGGAVLAACLMPQLWKAMRSGRAHDLAYGFLAMYAIGLLLSLVYLIGEGALAGWICLAVELGFALLMTAAKAYLDHFGPYSPRALARAAEQSKRLTNSLSLASDIQIEVRDFEAGGAALLPMLQSSASVTHAALHLLLDARLALPTPGAPSYGAGSEWGAAGAQRIAPADRNSSSIASASAGASSRSTSQSTESSRSMAGSEAWAQAAAGASGEGGKAASGRAAADQLVACLHDDVLQAVHGMLEDALAGAGLPVQRCQVHSFPSLRLRPEAPAKAGSGEAAAADMFFLSCRDSYATALFYPATATLSVDLLTSSKDALAQLGRAAEVFCGSLVAAWPGTRIAGTTVKRLPRG